MTPCMLLNIYLQIQVLISIHESTPQNANVFHWCIEIYLIVHWVKCGMSFYRIGEGFYDDTWPVIGMFLLQY